MAFYSQNEDEEGQQQGSGEQAGPAAQASQGGATIQGSGSSAAPGGAQAPKTPDHGAGNFVGIQTYLNANKPQSQKLGDQAAGVINTSADAAKSSLSGLQNQFNEKAGSGVASDANAIAKVGQGAENLNDQEKQTIKNQYNAQYTGPNDLSDSQLGQGYQDASSKLTLAQQNAQGAGTEQGRMGLIGQINNKARTQGETTFDNALLSAGGGRQKLADAALANKDVGTSMLDKANADAQAKAQANKTLTDQTRTQTQQAVGGAQDALNQGINTRLQDAIQNGLGLNNRVVQDVTDNTLDQDTANMYGLKAGDSTYGLNLGDYLTQADPNSINRAGIASKDEYARSQALADLSGGQGVLDQADIGKAGTSNPGPQVNEQKFQADRAQKEQDFTKQYNAPGTWVDAGNATGIDTQSMGTFLNSVGLAGATPAQIEQNMSHILNSPIPVPDELKGFGGAAGGKAYQDKISADRQKLPAMLARMKQAAGQTQQISLNPQGQ